MTKLNKRQQKQVEYLAEVTTEDFANAMLKHTSFITSEKLDEMYDEAMELEVEFSQVSYDANYHSVTSEYCGLDKDTIAEAFGYYGEYSLYMDEYGQGLIVSNYY